MIEQLELFVPGRVCLFGEHSDWAGEYRRINPNIEQGYTLITGTNQGIYARLKRHPDKLIIRSRLPQGRVMGPVEIPMEREALLREAEAGGFFSYAAGVAYQIMTNYYVGGLEIDNYNTNLPIKKGLSSSAAICVMVARAFNKIYDLKMTIRGEMEAAYQGELRTPSRCGRMDQGCAYGNRPILMIFDRELVTIRELRMKQDLHFVIVDLKGEKDTQEILSRLNRSFPYADNEIEKGVQYYLGQVNKQMVLEAAEALAQGDAEQLGLLMRRAQELFDRYMMPACPEQLRAPKLHQVLDYEPIQQYVWGGKGIGSQGDGSAQFIAKGPEEQQQVKEILEQDLGLECYLLDIQAGRRVRKAVIPAAGYGTRLFPATKVIKKELFPIIDRDGIAKPVILAIVEEAVRGGLEEICIIVQKGDEVLFDEFFNGRITPEHFNKLSPHYQDYYEYLLEIGKRISIVPQERQEGFGHAVWCARDWVGDEPFFLLLGDHLYRAKIDIPASQQLLEKYDVHQTNIVAVEKTPEQEVSAYGTVAGVWHENDESLLTITEFAEKPTLDYARTRLRVPGLKEGEYLCIFGQYVLEPEVFKLLEENIINNVREGGEFQLTAVLDRLRQRSGFLAYLTRGERFDIGLPQAYRDTIQFF